MRCLFLPALLLAAACSGNPAPPGIDARGHHEGLAFPDLSVQPDRPADRADTGLPPAGDSRADRPGDRPAGEGALDSKTSGEPGLTPDSRPPDHRLPDSAPPSPCFSDWSKWSCSQTFLGGCSSSCGGGLVKIVCALGNGPCYCSKGGVNHTCLPASGTYCPHCQAVFLAGCCNF